MKGRLDFTREMPQIICDELIELDRAGARLASNINILLSEAEITKEKIAQIKSICSNHRGKKSCLCYGKDRQRSYHKNRRGQKSFGQSFNGFLPADGKPHRCKEFSAIQMTKKAAKNAAFFTGERRELNPRPLEPQSNALSN